MEDTIIRGDNGRFQKGTRSPKPITHENAREMQRKGVLAKRAAVAAEANRSVEDAELLDRYGDYAYVAQLTRTQMQIATTPEAGKAAVMAAEWLVSNTGTSEKHALAVEQGDMIQNNVVLLLLAEAERRREGYTNTIDGDVQEE